MQGRPIRVEFLVQMEGHSDTDRDVSEDHHDVEKELPDMFEYSDDDDEGCTTALPGFNGFKGQNCKKKTVRKIGLRAILKVN